MLLKSSSQKKDKNIVFKAQQSHNSDVEDDDNDLDVNNDEMALLAKNLGKFLRLNKKFNNHPYKPNGNNNKGGPSNQRGNQRSKPQFGNNSAKKDKCYECHGKCHYA